MTSFAADILGALRELRQVAIRTEKHPKSAVVIWVAVADDEVFVRSVGGTKGRWYRDLAASGAATLEFAGRQLPVEAMPARRPRCDRPSQPRIPEEISAEPLCPGDGTPRRPANDAAARTTLTAAVKRLRCRR